MVYSYISCLEKLFKVNRHTHNFIWTVGPQVSNRKPKLGLLRVPCGPETKYPDGLMLPNIIQLVTSIKKQVSRRSALCRAAQDGFASSCLSCPISCSTTPSIMCTSSAHAIHPHVLRTCHPHLHIVRTCTLSAPVCHPHLHVIHMHTCHPRIICSTPHGQHGPKLSFYSDRIWLLNGICHKNVELFHFRNI